MIVSCENAPSLYPDEVRARLRACAPGSVAVAAIAGRDSVAAILCALLADDAINVVVPTSVGTGTEYGDASPIAAANVFLRRRIEELREEGRLERPIEVLDVTRFGSPEVWASLNGAPAATLNELFGMSSPCLACHLYLHIARVPLCLDLNSTKLISGERDTHDGRIKLSQTVDSIDAEERVLAHAGITFLAPLRTMTGEAIGSLVPDWPEGEKQLKCVHSKNYVLPDGSVVYDQAAHQKYIEKFFEPAGLDIVDAWLHRKSVEVTSIGDVSEDEENTGKTR